MIIDGDVDHIGERFFMYKGSIDEVIAAHAADSAAK
jgi:F0F1-type ATP synthase beta subunit